MLGFYAQKIQLLSLDYTYRHSLGGVLAKWGEDVNELSESTT